MIMSLNLFSHFVPLIEKVGRFVNDLLLHLARRLCVKTGTSALSQKKDIFTMEAHTRRSHFRKGDHQRVLSNRRNMRRVSISTQLKLTASLAKDCGSTPVRDHENLGVMG
ncbi:hypothetical protein JOH51_001646 [Rhizobium leguminosarum]|nr:hypothetical protein [Rhizobium leguminosarum]